jgi:hypothetical protein
MGPKDLHDVLAASSARRAACGPPEEVSKPDSVTPTQRVGVAAIHLVPRLPGGSSDRPEESDGQPVPTLAGRRPLHGLAPGGVYRASALSNGPGELLPHHFTLAPSLAARGGVFSVALSADRSAPPLTATLPCGVRTFLATPFDVARLLDLLRRTARRRVIQLASLCCGRQCSMRWQLGQRNTCSFRCI